ERPEIENKEQRQEHGELDRSDAAALAAEGAQAPDDAGRPGNHEAHLYGSFLKALVAISNRWPLLRVARVRPSGRMNTGHWYITRATTTSPGPPGLYCHALVTLPPAS